MVDYGGEERLVGGRGEEGMRVGRVVVCCSIYTAYLGLAWSHYICGRISGKLQNSSSDRDNPLLRIAETQRCWIAPILDSSGGRHIDLEA